MIHREDAEQKALIQWADIAQMPAGFPGRLHMEWSGEKIGQYLFAIPNGGKRGRTEAARFKGLGVRAGVSDLFFSFPSMGKHGLYIEMKAPKPHGSNVSDNQKEFQRKMRSVGYMTVVCYGFEEARHCITSYLTRIEPCQPKQGDQDGAASAIGQ